VHGGHLFPFRPDSVHNGECTHDISHGWGPQHTYWNGGRLDGFVRGHLAVDGAADGPLTMGYYTRADLPLHHALADAFTVCDRYHCSVLGPTDPNRLYTVAASLDPGGIHGGPILSTSSTRVERFGTLTHTTPRLIETRLGAEVPNLTAWRRAAVGDLTSALNLAAPDPSVPPLPRPSALDPRVITGTCVLSAPASALGDNVPGLGALTSTLVQPYPVTVNAVPPAQEPGWPAGPAGRWRAPPRLRRRRGRCGRCSTGWAGCWEASRSDLRAPPTERLGHAVGSSAGSPTHGRPRLSAPSSGEARPWAAAHDGWMQRFERLSTESKRALAVAYDEAERARAGHLGTEHLLLGVLGVDGSLGARALGELGLDAAAIRAGIEAAPARPSARYQTIGGAVPTTRLKRVIEMAFEEALRTQLTSVTTGTMLVGLVLEVDGLASQLLGGAGVTVDQVREALARLAAAGITEGGD
jgi:Phosphoesterase family/Clp amino terminal domain, pathogenicity island component